MPDIQLVAVWLIVALAAAFLVRRSLRTWLGKKGGCSGGCGCSRTSNRTSDGKSEVLIPVEQLTVRKR